jgi:hypothetical protein
MLTDLLCTLPLQPLANASSHVMTAAIGILRAGRGHDFGTFRIHATSLPNKELQNTANWFSAACELSLPRSRRTERPLQRAALQRSGIPLAVGQ